MLLMRREPTLLPLRTTPPGKGRITPGWLAIASTAASAAASAASASRARMRKLPPPTPLIIPNFSCTTNSPSITGIRQNRSPPITLLAWNPSPKNRRAEPTPSRSGAVDRPSKHAVVGQVSTVWPMRSMSRLGRSSLPIVIIRTLRPGRPSGVSASSNCRSMPASTLQPMTEVANPVSLRAASRAHRSLRAVTMIRATRMVNASAKVSSMSTPRMFTAASSRRCRLTRQIRDGVVLERHGRVPLEVAAQAGQHRIVVSRRDPEAPPRGGAAQVTLLDDQRPVLDHVARRREHGGQVGVATVDSHVGVGAHAEMALLREPEQARGPGPRDDRDLVEGVLPRQPVGQYAPGAQLGI